MPPLFTSTSWTTLVRKVVSAARQAQVQTRAALPAAARGSAHGPASGTDHLAQGVRRAHRAIRNALRETFPSLGAPSHRLGPSLSPIPIPIKAHHGPRSGPAGFRRYGSTMAFRTAYRLPRQTPSAAHMTGQVGLGSARTFASGPTSNVYISNVPVGFRALVQLLDKEDEYGCNLPRPRRYRPYRRSQRQPRRSFRAGAIKNLVLSNVLWNSEDLGASVDSALLHSGISTTSHFSHYFPFRSRTSAFVPVPLCPEELVTPGITTTLSLPLSPDLHALLQPTPLLSYEQAEIGASVMANLCQGLLTMEEAFDMYRQACLYPLLAHLHSLDVLREGPDPRPTKARGELIRDLDGRPDVLRLVFCERSVEDVRKILACTLKPNERGEEWWTLTEKNQAQQATLTFAESAAILEDWSPAPLAPADLPPISMMDQSVVDLVMPTLDVNQVSVPTAAEEWSDVYSSPASSDLPTPTTPSSEGISSPSSSGFSFPASLTSSLLSRLNDSNASYASWHVEPSADDIEVESMISFSTGTGEGLGSEASEIWSVADIQDISRPPSPERFSRWSGTSQGFGLAQPW